MGLSAAEKQRRYRERQKAKLGEAAVKAKEAAYKRAVYQKDPQVAREKQRQKMQSWRASKQAAEAVPSTPTSAAPDAYSAPSSLSRAVKRARVALPNTAEKRRRVVTALADEFQIPVPAEPPAAVPTPPKQSPTNKIPEDVRQRVRDFYLRHDISWTAPGRRDSVTVVRDGQKVQEQRHYLVMTLSEAYNLYKEEHPADSISFTVFKNLRPDVVKCKDNMPHNLCVCIYHENINLILQGLRTMPTIPLNHRDLLNFLVCDTESEDCMFGRCDQCKNKVSEDFLCELIPEHLDENIELYQWMRTPEGKTEKVKMSSSVKETIALLSQKLKAFKIHCLVKSKQAAVFQKTYSSPREGHATVQIDFSENATIIPQDEVQSGHWAHHQATVFTAVAWTADGTFSSCVVSDSLSHDKYAAAVFVDSVLDSLQGKVSSPLTEIDLFSDGAAQHFKQKFMFLYVTSLFESKGIRVNWHFFATSHGKGAVDGVGGTVKRAVYSAMKTRRAHVGSAEDYANVAKDFTKSTDILYVSNEDIEQRKPELDALWESVTAVPNTQSVHCVRTVEKGKVLVSAYSDQPGVEHSLLPVSASEPEQSVTISVGKWYAVYQEEPKCWCVGNVLRETANGMWDFSFIKETGRNTNRFRSTRTVTSVSKDFVFTEVESPAPASSTRVRVMKLTDQDYTRVQQLFSDL